MNPKFAICWNKHHAMTPYGGNRKTAPVFLSPWH